MIELIKEFPVLKSYTYLNTASCGLISRSLLDWRRRHDINLFEGGSVFRDLHKPHIESIRASVSEFFHASITEIALVPSFSFGFNTLLGGLAEGKKVLLLNTDYPSINWAVENRNFDVCYAEINENLEQNIEEAIANYRPDVFAFSLVQYISGVRVDLDFLKRLKAYHPDLLIIADGTQFLGTTNFNFSESGIDVLGASTYKWMLAGYGNGLFMVNEEAQGKILPKMIGFNSADAMYSRRDQIAFVKLFEPGHQDTLNYGSLQQSIKMLTEIGIDTIEEKISLITEKARASFTDLGLLDEVVLNRNQHSSIFNIKGDDNLFEKLKANQIICSKRGHGIRVSFHFYNSDEDLEKLISILKT
jgi:selenocysteine lyase/cysteine desulfurase